MRSYQGMFDGTNVRDGSFPHEAFTSDGSGGAFAGKIQTISGRGVDVGQSASPTWEHAAIAVLEGSGQGQVRRIANATGSVYAVDREWDVPVRSLSTRGPTQTRTAYLLDSNAPVGCVHGDHHC